MLERGSKEKRLPAAFCLKCLLFSYLFTALLLLLLAFLLYKLGITEQMVSAAIIGIYVASTFLAGFIIGKKMQSRKFLWGLFMGCMYFLVLVLVSLLVNRSAEALADSLLTTFILCAGGGMLGGMVG